MYKEFKKSNLYYLFQIIIKNYLKSILFIILGLIVGFILHHNTGKYLIIKKKISPLNVINYSFNNTFSPDTVMLDYIRLHRETIGKIEYDIIFDINSKFFERTTGIFNTKITTNIKHDEYLKLSKGFTYLRERIDYEWNSYDVSKSFKFKHYNKKFEDKKNRLKDDYNKYSLITNQITRYYLFHTLMADLSYYSKILKLNKSDLIVSETHKLYKKTIKALEEDYTQKTEDLNLDINKKIKDLNLDINKKIKDSNLDINKKIKDLNLDINKKMDIIELEGNQIELEGNQIELEGNQTQEKQNSEIDMKKYELLISNYDDKIKNIDFKVGKLLDETFKNNFSFSVTGLEDDFDINIIDKNIYYYLLICSFASFGVMISIIIIRDFIKNLKKVS